MEVGGSTGLKHFDQKTGVSSKVLGTITGINCGNCTRSSNEVVVLQALDV